MKKKKTSPVKIIAAVVLTFSTTAAIVFGYMGIQEFLDRKRGNDFYESVVAEKVMAVPTEPVRATQPQAETTASTTPAPTVEQPEAPGEVQPEPKETTEAAAEPAASNIPETTEASTISNAPEPAEVPAMSNTQETEELPTTPNVPENTELQQIAAEPDRTVITSDAVPEETYPLWDVWCGYNRHFTTGTEPSVLDFEAICVKFPDCVGWMEIPGLKLDAPVVQGEDNDFYLNHLPNRRESANGSLMMDKSCRGDFHSDITTIHGHFLRDGTMFGNLRDFQEEKFYSENPTFKLYTPDGDYTVEIFAANVLDGMEFGYPTELNTEEDFNDFVTAAKEACPYETDVAPQFGDRIILLSTCSYKFQFARTVVFGVLR